MEYEFTSQIFDLLQGAFGENGRRIFKNSPLFQYLNIKTRSVARGSKARSSFANLYAIYVLVEDYLAKYFDKTGNYADYEGARFSDLFERQRELPFGSKLQNHALNHRLNEEFRKYFPEIEFIPILRDVQTSRYWINENLLMVSIDNYSYNIAGVVITVLDRYIELKQSAFNVFIQTCEKLKSISGEDTVSVSEFIASLLAPNVDARIFEIVSYAILRSYYQEQNVFIGFELRDIRQERLKLYKTGRTNANDGGIDFVMRPLGRFFQVTETLDVKKFFLDIDKIERYPVSFVVKSNEPVDAIKKKLYENALRQYVIHAIVEKYMACIEEIINLPILLERYREALALGNLNQILDEIIVQSKVEFNFETENPK
jgi:hypothetical protein